MPISLSEYKAKGGKTDVIDLGDGDSITFTWHPNHLTGEVFDAIQAALNKPPRELNPTELGRTVIIPLVSAWDITDGKKPYELIEENIGRLPILLIMELIQRIQEQTSEATTKKDSSGG
jgi:hypothetical protein